jgi:hypothetical protein
MSILVIRTILIAKNHWLVKICIGLEVLFIDPISRCKVGTRTICGSSGNKVIDRTIPKDYVAIRIWEVCMPKAIAIVAHQMTNYGKTQIEI